MKILLRLLGLGLLLWQPLHLKAQENKPDCRDILYLNGGNKLTGQIRDLKSGDTLVFSTWNGTIFEIPRTEVHRIVQDCGKSHKYNRGPRLYTFRERGWYNNTRGSLLIGQSYSGENTVGFQLLNSAGWMFTRFAGFGLGAGIDFFVPKGNDISTYPVFAEIRGYLSPKPLTLFYCVGAGWAFPGQVQGEHWGYTDQWHGGWHGQAEVGYRIGNHLTVHFGLCMQQKSRDWASNWNPTDDFGTDRILNKRFVLGLGLLL